MGSHLCFRKNERGNWPQIRKKWGSTWDGMDPIIWLFPADLGKRSRENLQPSWSREGYARILSKGISAILVKMITRVLKRLLSPFWGPLLCMLCDNRCLASSRGQASPEHVLHLPRNLIAAFSLGLSLQISLTGNLQDIIREERMFSMENLFWHSLDPVSPGVMNRMVQASELQGMSEEPSVWIRQFVWFMEKRRMWVERRRW